MTIEDKPFWANERGRKVRILPRKPESRELTLTDGSSHIKILKHLYQPDVYTVRIISHHKVCGGQEQNDYMKRIFFGMDMATAFDIKDREVSTDSNIGRIYGVEFSSRGKFVRTGDWVSFFGPGSGQDGDSTLTIKLNDEIRMAVAKLMRTVFWPLSI